MPTAAAITSPAPDYFSFAQPFRSRIPNVAMPMEPGGSGGGAAVPPPRIFADAHGGGPRATVTPPAEIAFGLGGGADKENAPASLAAAGIEQAASAPQRRGAPALIDADVPKRTRWSTRNAAADADLKTAEANNTTFTAFAASRLWVDVCDANSIWWPAELVDGPRDDEVQVRLQRRAPTSDAATAAAAAADDDALVWVDPNTAVATAGSFAYYGSSESAIKTKQALLFLRTNVPTASGAVVPAEDDSASSSSSSSSEWVPAVVEGLNAAGVVSLRLLDRDSDGDRDIGGSGGGADAVGGATHRVHHQSKRLRPLGPSYLSNFNKVPVSTTIDRLVTLLKNTRVGGAGSLRPPPDPRAPLQPSSAAGANNNNSNSNGADVQMQRPAGAYNGARAPTRLVIAGGVPHVHFRDSLDAAGMRLFPCIGDGNCLFRSVAHQLYGDQVSD